MKNWKTCEADVVKILGKHFTKGRGGRKIDKIIVHYNAGNLTVEGCYSVWQTRAASAHYQVEDDGRIGQLVLDRDTAWHCGVFAQNQRSIGIEHANRSDGTITEKCLDNGAHLVAALCHLYKLGRPEWLRNVFPHKYFKATSCPGQIYGSQKDAYIKRAQKWYDEMAGKAPAPEPEEPGEEAETPGISVDGYWGAATTKLAQEAMGTVADGEVWGQNPAYRAKMPACTTGWKWSLGDGAGSPLVRALQKKWGAKADGIMGPSTINAMIGYYMARGSGAKARDGRLDAESPTVKAFQRELNGLLS